MSKASRRQQRTARQAGSAGATDPARVPNSSGTTTSGATSTSATGPSGAGAASGSGRHSTSPTGTARAGRRERQRVTYQTQSRMERYRGLIIGVAAVAGIALIGAVIFLQATAPAFACSTEFDPAPTPAPGAGASPQPGYVQDDMGRRHVATGEQVKYTYCPPASGNHYNASGQGPIAPRLYGPSDTTLPEGWIHNLEHGALVLLYRSDSEGATPAGQAALRAFYDSFPNSPVCNIQPGTIQGPVITQFDDMKTPFAALVWDRVLPLESLDTAAILEFYSIWGERTNPEPLCPAPSASPSAVPSTSAAPSSSAAPSATPLPSTSPSAAPSATSAAPVVSPSPS